MMKRIPGSFFASMNHFGVKLELSNSEVFLIHNSPSNKGKLGNEIIIKEEQMYPDKWEVHTPWVDVPSGIKIGPLIEPIQYKILSRNCFTSVSRVWDQVSPEVEFDIWYDPIKSKKPRKITSKYDITLEDKFQNLINHSQRFLSQIQLRNPLALKTIEENSTLKLMQNSTKRSRSTSLVKFVGVLVGLLYLKQS